MAQKKGHKRLKTLQDVRKFLAFTTNQFNLDLIDAQKAKAIAYLCSILHQIIKNGDLESRIDELEKAVGEVNK